MSGPVLRWMHSNNLIVKSEFITPWGKCDLVGLSFKKRNVAARLKLGQKRSVSSLTGSALLARIPDVETGEFITFKYLVEQCAQIICEEVIFEQTQRLIADGFVLSKGNRLQRLNGWVPLHKQLIAVELKLNRVEEAISQARNNLIFADKSYVGLPMDLAVRLAAHGIRRMSFIDSGVGLLSVNRGKCEVLIPSIKRPSPRRNPVIQFYCVEKFWRTCPKDN